jgi:hypothetical protein
MAMDCRKLPVHLISLVLALALPVAAAMAAGGGNGGSSGGGSGGGSSGGGSGSAATSSGGSGAGGAPLTIIGDNAANADYQQAQSAIDRQDYSQAAALLQQVLQRQPDNPDVLNLMGFSERKLGKASTALDYYKKALDLQPDHIGANEYLGELYLELKQPDMAEQRLAVLQQVCGDCEEYTELKEKIEQFKANPG